MTKDDNVGEVYRGVILRGNINSVYISFAVVPSSRQLGLPTFVTLDVDDSAVITETVFGSIRLFDVEDGGRGGRRGRRAKEFASAVINERDH